jgi:RND family efflux transporter MFP subunit
MIVQVAREGRRDAVFDAPAQLIRVAPRDPVVDVYLADNPKIGTTGRVREVSPQADPATRTHQVKVGLIDPPETMFLGATVVGRISLNDELLIELPAMALMESEGRPAVWVVDKATETVSLRPIEVARYEANAVIVAMGLQNGDIVVTAGVQTLRPGQKVRLTGAQS